MNEKFYITTAIAYTSRKPHIGNTYEAVFTDCIARYNRLRGKDVFFLTGTDEHGVKIQEAAEAAGVAPKEYVDRVAGEVREVWDLLNTSYDKFIRTTDPDHERVVSGGRVRSGLANHRAADTVATGKGGVAPDEEGAFAVAAGNGEVAEDNGVEALAEVHQLAEGEDVGDDRLRNVWR